MTHLSFNNTENSCTNYNNEDKQAVATAKHDSSRHQ